MTTQQETPTALQAMTAEGIPSARESARIVGFAVIGVLLTTFMMTEIPYPRRFAADVAALQDTTHWVVWVAMLAIQSAVWLALVFPIIGVASKSTTGWTPGLAGYVAFVLVLLMLPLLGSSLFAPAHPIQDALRGRLYILAAVGSVVGLCALVGVLRTGKQIDETPATAAAVGDYLDMRRRLGFLGGVLALIVALAVLSTGGQRNSIVAMETARATQEKAQAEATLDPDEVDEKAEHLLASARATERATRFGVELVWVYGLYYTFVLAVAYLPAYLSLLAKGRQIRDALQPLALPTNPTYEAVKKKRDAFDEILQLKLTASESLKSATLILIPLATSFASSLLGGVKVGG